MDFAEYFGGNLHTVPEAKYETYESWCFRLIAEEREAIATERGAMEALVRESLRPAAVDALAIPPMPDGVPVNESIRAAWAAFHGSPRPPRESAPAPIRRGPKSARMRPGSEDPSAWPERLRP